MVEDRKDFSGIGEGAYALVVTNVGGGTTLNSDSTFNGYTMQQIVAFIIAQGWI